MPQEIGEIYKSLIPSLSDDASIEEAFQMYHYGTATYNGNNLQPQSIEKHLIDLNEDISRIDGTISSLANVYVEEVSSSVRPNVIVSQEPPIVPLTIRGVLNQTAPLQRWQNNTGTPNDVALINGSGSAAFAGYISVGSITPSSNTGMTVLLGGNHKGVVVKGVSGQTEDLQQWQNNLGSVLSKVDSSGNITAPTINSTSLNVSGVGDFNEISVTTDAEITGTVTANKVIVSDPTESLLSNGPANFSDDVTVLGSTSVKALEVDGVLTSFGDITSTGNISATGDLSGANISLTQNLTTAGNITANGIIKAKSPNQGTTGALRVIADVNGNGYLQFVNSADTTELINMKATNGNLQLSGTMSVVSPVGSGSVGARQIYISTADATGGLNGDIWIKYIA